MKPQPSNEDLTLRTLDRLPPIEAREFDSRLAGDPALASELRHLEDAVTAVWQASSPLRAAPPDLLESIQSKLHPDKRRFPVLAALAVGGWAAALILFLWPRSDLGSASPPGEGAATEGAVHPGSRNGRAASAPSRDRSEDSDVARLRETIRSLQAQVRAAHFNRTSPDIRELRAPDDLAHSQPEERADALLKLLTHVLTETIARGSETPATLVVEDGWLESAFSDLPESGVIRHRTFPEDDFGKFDLLRSPEGDYYHPATNLLWSPAPDGGGYLGRIAPPDLDPSSFRPFNPDDTRDPEAFPESVPPPSGYIVRNGDNPEATVIIGNLDTSQGLPVLVASNDSGLTTLELSESSVWQGEGESAFATYIMPAGLIGNSSIGEPVTIFQTNPDGTLSPILIESP